MISPHRVFIAACFVCLFPLSAFSEAPVVDDSENFALLDEQAAMERPVASAETSSSRYDEEPAFAKDNVETTSNNGNNAAILDKVQGMRQEIQELRGQLEVQAHDLKLLQEQQLAFYKDLDARVRHEPAPATKNTIAPLTVAPKPAAKTAITPAAKATSPAVVSPALSKTGSNNPADEQVSYLAAYELIKNKQFEEALVAMHTFVAQYPQGGYTANAQYWLGELYMVQKSYPQAIEHFEIVLHQFPSSSKSAASMLKIGYALAESGKKNEAILRLQQVMKNYPDTNTAQLAAAKLEKLNS